MDKCFCVGIKKATTDVFRWKWVKLLLKFFNANAKG